MPDYSRVRNPGNQETTNDKVYRSFLHHEKSPDYWFKLMRHRLTHQRAASTLAHCAARMRCSHIITFHMHQLPFGAQVTEKLFRILQKKPECPSQSEMVHSLVWAPQSFAVPGKAGWVLAIIPKAHSGEERVFVVDGLPIFISTEVEPLMRDLTFDWEDDSGIVARAG